MRYMLFRGTRVVRVVSASNLNYPAHLSHKGNVFSNYFDSGVQFAFCYY